MKKQLLFILITISFSFFNCNRTHSTLWKSQFHSFEIEFSNDWSIYEESDTKEKLLFGLINKNDEFMYHVDITTQPEYKNLSDEDYFVIMKKYYLSLNEKNKFLSEEEIKLHGENFRGNSFLFYNDIYGFTKLYDIVKREKDLVIGITIAFPVDEKNAKNQTIPEVLLELDKHAKINGK